MKADAYFKDERPLKAIGKNNAARPQTFKSRLVT